MCVPLLFRKFDAQAEPALLAYRLVDLKTGKTGRLAPLEPSIIASAVERAVLIEECLLSRSENLEAMHLPSRLWIATRVVSLLLPGVRRRHRSLSSERRIRLSLNISLLLLINFQPSETAVCVRKKRRKCLNVYSDTSVKGEGDFAREKLQPGSSN